MRIISKKAIEQFANKHPEARQPLNVWQEIVRSEVFNNFGELRKAFASADKFGNCTVFNIGGNKFRLIAAIHYNRQIIYIRQILTHAEYDLSKWKYECEK